MESHVKQPPRGTRTVGESQGDAGAKRYPDALFALWFGQFQQLSWLSTVAAGGVFALLQGDFIQFRLGAGMSITFFALAALLGVLGPLTLQEGILEQKDVGRTVRLTILAAIVVFGTGMGALAMSLLLPA